MNPAIVWFRNDLRLADNPALHAAAASKRPLVCVYIYNDEPDDDENKRRAGKKHGPRSLGAAARWWLHGSLQALDAALAKHGGRLTILTGAPTDILPNLAADLKATAVYWNRRYDASGRALDATLETTLQQGGIEVTTFNGHLLNEPWTLENQSGKPFRVFTAYWRAVLKQDTPEPPLKAPRKLRCHATPRQLKLKPVPLTSLGLEPKKPDWAAGIRATWTPGEASARAHLKRFLTKTLSKYSTDRDRPDRAGTSRLSPYLSFGNISARQIWHTAHEAVRQHPAPGIQRQLAKFLAEIGWREFNYHVLYHHPGLAERNFQSRFDPLRWRTDPKGLQAWQRGLTGYPIVDAGMRELWTTGWMHNRVRMVAASFLVKHLLIDWRTGEQWFWDTLVDADPANNAANWQWVAGSGADAAPYFRIFNPILQGEKFDPNGDYVRRWVPELARLPAKIIHKPWTAKPEQLDAAGVRLGKTYPRPIVDHDMARRRALLNVKSLA
ncbi:MAG TPA: deoxyribodipyrimidine photo-lyase [Steroidobacteraceae bacterium]|nr:deoxyribodipyrimidine photo-lyase [Steroidobacteraceae bacterium]